jgi:hypothetical protein
MPDSLLPKPAEVRKGAPAEAAPDDAPSSVPMPVEDTDGRALWKPRSKYEEKYRRQQTREAIYISALLVLSISLIGAAALGAVEWVFSWLRPGTPVPGHLRGCVLLASAGFLGGTVYGAKWLYHAVAKGLWHEDRALWRYLTPWISLGVTVGVGAFIYSNTVGKSGAPASGSSLVGTGFLIGYFSDKALAKMKDVAEVLFGETRSGLARRRTPDDGSD